MKNSFFTEEWAVEQQFCTASGDEPSPTQAGMPVLHSKVAQTFLSVGSKTTQAGMPVLHSKVTQTFLSVGSKTTQAGMPVLHSIETTQRNLPHWKKEGAVYWIAFRLADSIPQNKLNAWKEGFEIWLKYNPKPWDESQWRAYNQSFGDSFEAWLDAGTGSCALARSDIREALIACLLKFNNQRLILRSAVIMPNHVHCLLELKPDEELSTILKGIKGASARAANTILGTSGRFWMDESYDHIVRSEEQYAHFFRYIKDNPIKAQLREDEYWLYEGVR